MRLRPYQRDACLSGVRNLREHDSTLVVHATGTGKTIVAAVVAQMWRNAGGGRVLAMAPREELIDQLQGTFQRILPVREIDVAVEQGDRRAPAGTPFVIASPQSLHDERLEGFRRTEFDLLIADEAHLFATPTGRRIFDYFDSAKRLGFTATPDRLDGRPLVPEWFASVAHVYELPDAIEDGFLAPLRFRSSVVAEFNESHARALDRQALGEVDDPADYDAARQIERAMMRLEVLGATAATVRQLEGKTLVFCVSVDHAKLLASHLGEQAAALDGESPARERREVMEAFRRGERVRILCNCMLYTYGLDIPDLANVVLARPTASRALYSQMVGRVTRLFPGKEFGTVVDMVGMVGSHGLVTPSRALQERFLDQPVGQEREAVEWTDTDAEGASLLEELEEAMAARVVEREVDFLEVDPDFAIFGFHVEPREHGERNATPAQVEALGRAGVEHPEHLSFEQAQAVFDQLATRRSLGLCTIKMGRVLARKGLNPNAPFTDAEWAIDRIRANHWRVPPAVAARQSLRYGGATTLKVR